MSMSKKHYEAIAKALGQFEATILDRKHQQEFNNLTGELCKVFADDNPNFVSWRFIQAIEKESESLSL